MSSTTNWPMIAWFCGCVPRPVNAEDGILSWERIREAVIPLGPHRAPTGLVEIENTSNMGGGSVYSIEATRRICAGTHDLGLKVHLDGARIFNAAEHLGRPVRELVADVDTVSFCLSKALGAPVGSMIARWNGRTDQPCPRLYRKRLGGGMRQAGILAAAGLIAIEEHPAKLATDHANARFLAEALSKIPGVKIDPRKVQTNIVIYDVSPSGIAAADFSKRLKEKGVLMNAVNATSLRAVTHYDVSREQIELALAAVSEIAQEKHAVQAV